MDKTLLDLAITGDGRNPVISIFDSGVPGMPLMTIRYRNGLVTLWFWSDAPQVYKDAVQAGDDDYLLHCGYEIADNHGIPFKLGGVIAGKETYIPRLGYALKSVLNNGDVIVGFSHA